ncbi:MAG: hypothetical protein G01um101438_215 [Parcubacteria group bacterium Gr01-1014_38]|nr:MAG: hypothetical protein G01um101438_215 [Parcubacteria group bacterium Gr01-1014_38]
MAGIFTIGAVAVGAVLLGLSTAALTVPPRWHGALMGIMVGLYGLLLFSLGYTWSVRLRNTHAPGTPDQDRPGPTPEEAKFWLRKFLEEQQKRS